MAVYAFKTYKAHFWASEIRKSDGSSYCLTIAGDLSRDQAFSRIAAMRWDKEDRISWLKEVNEKNIYDMELYGFLEIRPAPALYATNHAYLDN